MPTPIEHVHTDNQMAPSYEYRPPALPDAALPDAGDVGADDTMDAGLADGRLPDAGPSDGGLPDGPAAESGSAEPFHP